jgi:hypothetical protein
LTDLPQHDWEVILLNNKETCLNMGTVLIEKGKQNTKLIKLMRGSLEVLLGKFLFFLLYSQKSEFSE